MRESISIHYHDIVQQYNSFKGLAICATGANVPSNPDRRTRMHADAPMLRTRPTQDATHRTAPAVTTKLVATLNVEDDYLYLSVPKYWPGVDELKPGKNDRIPNVVKLQLKYSIDGYLQSNNVSMEGSDFIRELRQILECFGYRMNIRSSCYIYDEKCRKQLPRVDFVCPYGENKVLMKPCRFIFAAFTTTGKFFRVTRKELNAGEDLDKFYSTKFPESWHDHPPSCDKMKRSLPPAIPKEDISMKQKSLVATEDVVRHLEDKYGFQLNLSALGRQLHWNPRKNHPAEHDFQLLIQKLFDFSNKMLDMYAKTCVVEIYTLHSVCWSFPEWQEDYPRHDVVPGVSIDAKALTNFYNISLVSICGRTSNGSLWIYFMGFIPAEDTE